jgi:hypothetical protein
MTAPPSSAPVSPFLAWTGRPERTLWRAPVWIALGVLLTVIGTAGLLGLFSVVDPETVKLTLAAQAGPFSGPDRLLLEARFMAFLALSLTVTGVAFLVAARLLFRRPAWTFVSPVRPFSTRYLLLGFGVYGGLLAASLGLSVLLAGAEIGLPVLDPRYDLAQRLTYAAAAVPFLLLAAAAEELLCRGLVLQVTGAWLRNRALLAVLNGVVFAGLHLDPDPAAFLSRTLMGAVWAWAALELGGLEFGIGAHFANNLLLVLLVEPLSSAAQTNRPYPLSDTLQDVATGVLTLMAVRALGRRLRRAPSE